MGCNNRLLLLYIYMDQISFELPDQKESKNTTKGEGLTLNTLVCTISATFTFNVWACNFYRYFSVLYSKNRFSSSNNFIPKTPTPQYRFHFPIQYSVIFGTLVNYKYTLPSKVIW